jgi:CRP/FNR family transcriptional regulator, cyclic AMP receptor protein
MPMGEKMTLSVNNLERVSFKDGDVLFREGDQDFFFFIIESGQVEIFLNEEVSGKEIYLAVLGPGQPVGEFALVVKKARSASARAKGAVSAVKIYEDAYNKLLKDLPDWAFSLIQSLIERIRTTDEMLRKNQSEDTLTLETIEDILKRSES